MFSLSVSLLLFPFLITPSTIALILPPSIFRVNTTPPPSNNAVFQCDGTRYGHYLGFADCLDALNQIRWREDQRPLGFGPRGAGVDYDILLPYRIVSLNGLCAIDVILAPRTAVLEDHALGIDIANDIAVLIAKCVVRQSEKLGGIAMGRGTRGNLALIVRSHISAVTCRDALPATAPTRETCRNMMDRMPLSSNTFLAFGNRGQPGVNVGLPLLYFDNSRQCHASIITTGGTDASTWGEVWNTAIDIDGMCVRLGKNGVAKFGLHSLLSMTIVGTNPVGGYPSRGIGDVNPVIGNVTTA